MGKGYIQIPLGSSPAAYNRRQTQIVCILRVDNFEARCLVYNASGLSRPLTAKRWGKGRRRIHIYIQDMHDPTSNSKGNPMFLLVPVQHNGSKKEGQSIFAGMHSSTCISWISYTAGHDNSPRFRVLPLFFAWLRQPSASLVVLEGISWSPDADTSSCGPSWTRLSFGRESGSRWNPTDSRVTETGLSKLKP